MTISGNRDGTPPMVRGSVGKSRGKLGKAQGVKPSLTGKPIERRQD